MDTLSNIAAVLVDQRAAMTPAEKRAIQDPLERSLSRFQPHIIGALTKYADPVAVVISFALWANRVRELRAERAPEPSPSSAPAPDQPPAEVTPETPPFDDMTGATPIPAVLFENMRGPF